LEARPITFIPHKRRLARHRVEYLKAINEALDYPFQAEDGKSLSPIQRKLQEKCIELSGLPYWTFTNCCTDSLQIAVHCLTNPGDTVVVPAYGWRAITNAVAFMNRKIEFVDVDETGTICLDSLDKLCKELKEPATAIIVVHNFGTIVNCKKISDILVNNNWTTTSIIEDAAQAFYMNEPTDYIPGSSSDVVCYSFDFTKNPGTLGSGGGIATRFEDVADRIYITTNHGASKAKQPINIGTKSYLDNTSCAVLLKEIEIFEKNEYRKLRRYNASWLDNNLPYKRIPGENYISEKFLIEVSEYEVSEVLNQLKNANCLAKKYFNESLNTYSFYENSKKCPGAEKLVKNTIMIPCHQYLEKEELNRIAEALA
jgi:dTDP-4-amino-4,6-dideoxygalactose transaminase